MKAINILNHELFLHWDKALWWPAQKALLVADTHFCKDSIFREHGIALPPGSDNRDLARLQALVRDTSAERLIVLGDFVHGAIRKEHPFVNSLQKWSDEHAQLELIVISGNHDRYLTKQFFPCVQWRDRMQLSNILLEHEANTQRGESHGHLPRLRGDSVPSLEVSNIDVSSIDSTVQHTIAGHLHPVIKLSLGKSDRVRMPILWSTRHFTIMPAFGSLTGGYHVKYLPNDRIFAFGEGEVVGIQ